MKPDYFTKKFQIRFSKKQIFFLSILFSFGLLIVWSNSALAMTGSGTAADPYIIENVTDLQNMQNDLTAYYELGGNIDASATSEWNGNAGFIPVGVNDVTPFTGQLDGEDYTIDQLFIDRDTNDTGLFSVINGAVIQNVKMTNVSIDNNASADTGALVGQVVDDEGSLASTITNCSSTGTVDGASTVGGLLGQVGVGGIGATVTNCWSSCTVTADTGNDNGGLIGSLDASTISNCYATGNVTGVGDTGGFAGDCDGDTISDCYATGDVVGSGSDVGGFIGFAQDADIDRCYATGTVTGSDDDCGGFVGQTDDDDTTTSIDQCYSTGTVTDTADDDSIGGFVGYNGGATINDCYSRSEVVGGTSDKVGGFCGQNEGGKTITDCYSTGAVAGDTEVGGFCGDNNGTVTTCFWDTTTSGQASDGADSTATGKTTAQMKTRSTFTGAGWDFNTIWAMCTGVNGDYLSLLNVTLGCTLKKQCKPSGTGCNSENCEISLYDYDNPPGTPGVDNSGLDKCYFKVWDSSVGWTVAGAERPCDTPLEIKIGSGLDNYCRTNGEGACTVYAYSVDNAGNESVEWSMSLDICFGCLIGGTPYGDGECNPANDCEICDPMQSTTAWSPIPAGYVCTASGELPVDSTNYCEAPVENCYDPSNCLGSKLYKGCDGFGSCSDSDTNGYKIAYPTACDGEDCGTCCLCADGQSPDYTQDGDCSAGGYTCTNPLTCSGHYHEGICDETINYTCTLAAAETPDASQCDGEDCGTCCTCAAGRSYDPTQDTDCSAGGYTCTNPLTCSGHYHQGACVALDSCGLDPTEIPDASQCDGLDCGTCCLCSDGQSPDHTQDGDCSAGGYICDNPLTCSGHYHQGICDETVDYSCTFDPTEISDASQCDGLDCGTCCLCAAGRSYDSTQDIDCPTGGGECSNPLTCSGYVYQGICQALDSCGYDPVGTPDPSQCDGLDCGTCCLCSNGQSPDYTQDGDCSAGGYECSNPLTCSGHYHEGMCDETIDYSCTLDPVEVPDASQCDGLDCGTCCTCAFGRSYDSTQDTDCSAGGYTCSNPLTCSGHYYQGTCTALDSCGLDPTEVPDASQCDGLDCGSCCLCSNGQSPDYTQDGDCSAGGYECSNPLTCSGHYHQGMCDETVDYSCTLDPIEISDPFLCDGLDCGEKSDTCDDYCLAKKLVEYNNNCIQDSTPISCDKTCDALGICQDCTLPSCPPTITHCCDGDTYVCGAGCDDDFDCPGESICQDDCACSGVRECGPATSICCDGFYWCAPGEVFNGTNCTPVSSTNYCDTPVESCDDPPNCQGSKFYKGCSASHICSDSSADGYIEDYNAACDDESCDDGLWCTINDSCTSGVCSGDDRPCGDLNPCTLDSCNEIENKCENIPITECYLGDGACVDGVWWDDHRLDGIQDCDEEGIDCGGADCPSCCLSIGLAEPIIEPSSPTENTDFTIYCPVSIDITDTLQPDCLNAYAAVGDSDQCTFLEWQTVTDQAKFTCSGLSAGNHTARCEVATGTPSNCCSEDAKTKDYSIFNQPPYKPTPSPEYPGGVSWNHCAYQGISIPTFHWIYYDPDGDPQAAYEIRIDNDSDFSVIDDDEFKCDGEICSGGSSPSFSPLPYGWGSWMNWDTDYWWIVRVKDSNDNWSEEWSDPSQFRTPLHTGPWPEFTPSPSRVSLNQVVTFEDNSRCYTFPGNNEFKCQDLPLTSYQWDFDYIEPAFTVDDTTKGNATTSYGDFRNYKVKLRITDDVDACYSKTETVTVTRPLPEWMEIPPF